MTDTSVTAGRTPWWFWLVCVLAVLWNGFGAYDFTMSVTQGDAYYRSMGMTPEMIAYMHAYPAWMYIVWIAGVWGAVLGTILLILRRRWAFHAFVVSLIGLMVSLIYSYGLSNGAEVMGDMQFMNFVILAGCVFFVWFAWWTTKEGLLR